MPLEFQKIFNTLMQITPKLAEEEDSERNSSEDEEQDPRMMTPVSIDTEMSGLFLGENRPAYSRAKSCANETVYFVGINAVDVSGIIDNDKSEHLRMSYIL